MDFHRQSLSDRLSALLASVSGQRQPIPAASTPARLPEKKRELTAGEIETLPQVLDFIKATSNPKKIRDVVARFLQNPLLSENDRELVKKKVLEKIEEEKRKKEAKKASTEPNTTLSSSSSSATTVCEPPKVEKHTTFEHGRAQPPRPAHEASQRGSASRAEPPPRASYGPQGKTVSEATSTRQSGTSSQASAGQSKQQTPKPVQLHKERPHRQVRHRMQELLLKEVQGRHLNLRLLLLNRRSPPLRQSRKRRLLRESRLLNKGHLHKESKLLRKRRLLSQIQSLRPMLLHSRVILLKRPQILLKKLQKIVLHQMATNLPRKILKLRRIMRRT